MRYDTKITFIQDTNRYEYDPVAGRNKKSDPEKDVVYGNVTSLGTQRSNELFGDIQEGALVVRLLNHYNKPFTSVRVFRKDYKVITNRKLRRRQTFILEEGV